MLPTQKYEFLVLNFFTDQIEMVKVGNTRIKVLLDDEITRDSEIRNEIDN